MSVELVLPKFGLTMKAGTVSKWFVAEGAAVKKGDPLYEVETDKITNKVESPADGVLFQILVQPKTKVDCGTLVGILAEGGEALERRDGGATAPAGDVAGEAKPKAKVAPVEAPKQMAQGPVSASPAAKRLARELGVDLAQIKGTGAGGRIGEGDVQAYADRIASIKITPLARELAQQAGLDIAAIKGSGVGGKITRDDVERLAHPEKFMPKPAAPARPKAQTVPFEGMRRIIADNMQASLANAAQLTLMSECDVTECRALLDDLKARNRKDPTFRISMNDVVILAVSKVLKLYPRMNSVADEENIIESDDVNVCMAVALDDGLIVPALHNTDRMGLLEIARETRKLAGRARKNQLTPDDMSGGTFTVTNMSHSAVDFFTPIINAPQTGILGVGRIVQKAVVRGGQVAVRDVMGLSLTFDHRVMDGAPAGEFLTTLVRMLEEPTLLLF